MPKFNANYFMTRLLLFIIFPLALIGQSSKNYPSLLWKISGNGLKKPSYLYGTMHVSKRVAFNLSEQFFDALKSVDVVGLETNPGEWLDNMEKTGELSQLNEYRPTPTGNNFYRYTFAPFYPERRTWQNVLSYEPDIINGLLYRQNASRENFEERTYIDLFIFQSASKLNKHVISLENFQSAEIKSKLSEIPDDEPENTNNNTNYYTLFQKIEDAYREGNLDLIDSLSRITSSKNKQKFLIEDRNEFFVNTIDSVLHSSTIFSGVGAAHLPGKMGVIELLRKKGYTLEPIMPHVSKKSNAQREELDEKFKTVSFQKQSTEDSLFTVNMPGKLYPLITTDNLKYYIYPDMVNGSFYTIVRLKHYAILFNQTAEQILNKVDSLLFENIPGKILKKEKITSNTGLKGIDLITKTRSGDEQHYQLFFNEVELIIFKLGGKYQYATSSDSKQFFSSISFINRGENQILFSPKTKGFEVSIPANYSYQKNNGSSLTGLVEDVFAYNKTKKNSAGIKHAVYNSFDYLEVDTFELNQFYKNCILNYNYTINPQSELINEQNVPCIRFKGANKAGAHFYAKVYIKGVHYYFVYYISETESNFDNPFFKSFKLIDFEHVNPIKPITDVDFCFKVNDETSENALSKFNEAFQKEYEKVKPKKKDDTNAYEYKSASKLYYSPSSNEYINIQFEKYNDYDFKNLDSLEKQLDESFSNHSGMFVTRKKVKKLNNEFIYTCWLKDTATRRAIDTRIWLKNGIALQYSIPVDTIIGLKGWAKSFMETFTPLDTNLGKPIFENKFSKLLSDLCSNDTVVKQAANNSLRLSLSFKNEYSSDFLKFINSPSLALVNEESRAQLFVNAGLLQNEKIILPFKSLYKQYTDSFYLQLCLVKGLAFLKTQNSFNTFKDLLLSETPLVGSEATIDDVFAALHDSLELCKPFFPSFLSLTKYDEYRNAIYSLMASMVNKKLLTVSSYEPKKDIILADANLALKRYTPGSTKNPQENDYAFDQLDKLAKELAENLRLSLDGLSNNTSYKNTKVLSNIDAYNRLPLVNYAWILAPLYKTDDNVKQFFNKLFKLKSQNVLLPLSIALLKQNIILNDTLIEHYCKNKFTRAFYYSELEKENLLEKFNKNYASQLKLIESVLVSQKQLSSFYNYEKDKNKKDSFILIKELSAKNKYQNGSLYMYKLSKTKNDAEQWTGVFVNGDVNKANSKMEVVIPLYYIDSNKTEEANLAEALEYFCLKYRYRAQPNNNNQD